MLRFLKNNGLSLAFWTLFLACLLGQAISGYFLQYEHAEAGEPVSALWYLVSANFLEGVFANWQAALIQFFALIVFAIFLRQRGASHSRKLEAEDLKKQPARADPANACRSWLYNNSLSLAFFGLFVLAFGVHLIAGRASYNAERVRFSEPVVSLGAYFISAKFWFETLQTWQAEFFVIATFLVLSVYLRQEKSAESKPVEASDEDTGKTNE